MVTLRPQPWFVHVFMYVQLNKAMSLIMTVYSQPVGVCCWLSSDVSSTQKDRSHVVDREGTSAGSTAVG